MAVGMMMAAMAAKDNDNAGKDDNKDNNNGNKTQTTINLCVGNGQSWAGQGRLWRRFGGRWHCCAIVIVPVAVKTTTMMQEGRSRTCR